MSGNEDSAETQGFGGIDLPATFKWAWDYVQAVGMNVTGLFSFSSSNNQDGESSDDDDSDEEFFDPSDWDEVQNGDVTENENVTHNNIGTTDSGLQTSDQPSTPIVPTNSAGSDEQVTPIEVIKQGGEGTNITQPLEPKGDLLPGSDVAPVQTLPPDPMTRAATVKLALDKLDKNYLRGITTIAEKTELQRVWKEITKNCTSTTLDADQAEAGFAELTRLIEASEALESKFENETKPGLTKPLQELDILLNTALRSFKKKPVDLVMSYEEKKFAFLDMCQSLKRRKFDQQAVDSALEEIRKVVQEIQDASPEGQRKKDLETVKLYKYDDPTTWDVLDLLITGPAQGKVDENDDIPQRVSGCDIGDRNKATLICTGSPMHAHYGNSGGISFTYVYRGGNRVQPVIYNYASSRSDNDYYWGGQKKATGGAAPLPGNL